MDKKNLPKQNSFKSLMGYSAPKFHLTAKSCYVDFYCFDPAHGVMRRKKYNVEKCKSKKETERRACDVISLLNTKLRSGWNPFVDSQTSRTFTPLDEICDRYLDHVNKSGRDKTKANYRSRLNVMLDFNSTRINPIKYAYQYDSVFITEFLDYIFLDREGNARTRNNYRGWCSSFAEFLVARKYIDSNPVSCIPKIKEGDKKRKILTEPMLQTMASTLEVEDKHFYLACLMEYFTFIRPTELSYIKIGDISLANMEISISAAVSKNGKDGKVGINAILGRLMIDLEVFASPSDFYLFGRNFQPSAKRIGPDQFNKRWAQFRNRMRWGDEYQFYSLKDTGIQHLANAEGIVVARDQARHSDIATTNKYLSRPDGAPQETRGFAGFLASKSIE